MKENEVKSYKWVSLKENPPKNAVLYVLDPRTRDIELYITDKNGNPKPVKIKTEIDIRDYVRVGSDNAIETQLNQLFVKKYVSGDEFISIEPSGNKYEVRLNIDKVVELIGTDVFELKVNKQNSLQEDGTGEKFPTVDAVKAKTDELTSSVNNLNTQVTQIINQTQTTYHHFSHKQEVKIQHNLLKYPRVDVMIGTDIVLADTEHSPDMNSVTVRFGSPQTGIVVIN